MAAAKHHHSRMDSHRVRIMSTVKDDRIETLERRVRQLELMLESHLDSLLIARWKNCAGVVSYIRSLPEGEDEIDRVLIASDVTREYDYRLLP